MLEKLKLQSIVNIFLNLFFITIILTLIFTRSFMGIYILNRRLGEFIVAFGLVLVVSYLLYVFIKRDVMLSNFPFIYYFLVFVVFNFSVFSNRGSLFAMYTFKSSSFIWITGYLFFGFYLFKYFKLKNYHKYALMLTPFVIYVFNSGNYPNFIMYYFQQNSDKFQFTKGSDVLMALIFCSYFLKDLLSQDRFILFVNLNCALLIPLFLSLSRASFFSAIIFVILVNFSHFKIIKNNIKRYILILIVSAIMLIISTIRVAGLPEISFRSEEPIQVIQNSVNEVVERKNVNKFYGFYFCEERICSEDNTLDWRLDIWFDLSKDMIDKGKVIIGFGFNEIFEIMKDPSAPGRLGRDGLNENVHNHIFTIFGRMGLIGLIVYILFQFRLLKTVGFKIIIFLFPLFLVSLFDSTMESIQFPLLYYLLISYKYSKQ